MIVQDRDQVHYNGSPVALAAGPNRLDARRAATEGEYTIRHVLFPWFAALVPAGQDWPVLGRCKFARYSNAPSRCFFALPPLLVPLCFFHTFGKNLSLFIRLVNERILRQRGSKCYCKRNPFIAAILRWNWI